MFKFRKFRFYFINRNLNEILDISWNIESIKKYPDRKMEMLTPRTRRISWLLFQESWIGWQMNVESYFNTTFCSTCFCIKTCFTFKNECCRGWINERFLALGSGFFFVLRLNHGSKPKRIEYILEWNLDSPSVWILSVPFSLYKSYKCSQIICSRVH